MKPARKYVSIVYLLPSGSLNDVVDSGIRAGKLMSAADLIKLERAVRFYQGLTRPMFGAPWLNVDITQLYAGNDYEAVLRQYIYTAGAPDKVVCGSDLELLEKILGDMGMRLRRPDFGISRIVGEMKVVPLE